MSKAPYDQIKYTSSSYVQCYFELKCYEYFKQLTLPELLDPAPRLLYQAVCNSTLSYALHFDCTTHLRCTNLVDYPVLELHYYLPTNSPTARIKVL